MTDEGFLRPLQRKPRLFKSNTIKNNKMIQDNPIYGEARVLNNDGFHSVAAIAVNLDSNLDGEITISDCNRVISLSIDIDGLKSAENSLYKVETLIEVLSNYKDQLNNVFKKLSKNGYYDIEENENYYEKSREIRNKILYK